MACHGEYWWRKHGTCKFKATRKDNATTLSLRRVTLNRLTGTSTSKTFGTSAVEAGVSWTLTPARTYSLYLSITRQSATKPGVASIELTVRDQKLVDNDCSTLGEKVSGDWQVKVFAPAAGAA